MCQYRTSVHDVIKKSRIPLQIGYFFNISPTAYFEMKTLYREVRYAVDSSGSG
jgi:hypothetical protein